MTDRPVRRRDDALAARQRAADLRVLMEQPAFQRWLGWLLVEHCRLLQPEGCDALGLAWSAGRRSVATELLAPLVNAERGVLSALLGTFFAEQGLDRTSDTPLSDHAASGITWRRDTWGDPVPARDGRTALERGDASAVDPADPLAG